MADNTKDKEMAARLKGSSNAKKVASNGVEKFSVRIDGEFREVCRCPLCHTVVGLTLLDAHLRSHGVGNQD